MSFPCPCGQQLEVEEQYAGVDVSCPTCNGVVRAPARRAVVVRTLAPPPRRSIDDNGDRPRRSSRRVEDDEEDRPSRRRRSVEEEDEDEEDDRPRRRKRKKTQEYQSIEGRIFNGSVVGGAIAMLIAVVWFVVGFFAGWVFFYPPILFIIGLIGFIRGLINRE